MSAHQGHVRAPTAARAEPGMDAAVGPGRVSTLRPAPVPGLTVGQPDDSAARAVDVPPGAALDRLRRTLLHAAAESAAGPVIRRLPRGTRPTPGARYRYARYVETGHRPAVDDEGDPVLDEHGQQMTDFEQEYEHHVGVPTAVAGDSWTFPGGPGGDHVVDVADVVEELPAAQGDPGLLPLTRTILGLMDDLGLADLANTYGISVEQLLSVAIELDASGAGCALPQYSGYLLTQGESAPSCYNSATILYNLLAANPLTTTVQRAEGFQGAPVRKTAPANRTRLRKTCTTLCTQIRAVPPAGPKQIFAVHFGGHGFTIVCDGHRAELLQSFAGASGDLLANYLTGNVRQLRSYSVDAIVQLLMDMIAEPTTLRAQSLLFGARADDLDLETATFRWTCSDVKPTDAVVAALKAWVTANLSYLARVHAAREAASRPRKKRRMGDKK